jgi:hypothetical protein
MKLRWEADPELSAARAIYVVATGMPCTDAKLEHSLIGAVTEINHRLVSASIDNGRFWTCYFDRCVAGDDWTTAVSVSLTRSQCSVLQLEQTARGISSRLTDARHLFFQRFPKLDEQLPLRIRPLRERWETIGPGLLREVERQVWQNSPPHDWWPPGVSVSTVQPLTAGGGGFDPDADSIWIEAMLTDADPLIPEVLRVVWLVTSLAIETHIRSRTGERMISNAWSLVSVPLVLSAASQLEMFPAAELPIGRAVQMWHGGSQGTIETLDRWWQDFAESSVPLPLALQQLEKQLHGLC